MMKKFQKMLMGLSGVETISGHTFISGMMNRNSTVLDLGANEGVFSHAISSKYNCRCVAVEPNPELAGRIRSRGVVEVIESAAAAGNGVANFRIASSNQDSSLLRISEDRVTKELPVKTRSLESLAEDSKIMTLDLLKVDIEGAEIEVLMSATKAMLERINQISVEFHLFCGLVSYEEYEMVRDKLLECGFIELDFEPSHMNMLFVKRVLFPRFSWRLMMLKRFVAPVRKLIHETRTRSSRWIETG